MKNRTSLDELIRNAEMKVVSRDAYIEKTISDIMHTPLCDFIDRGCEGTGSNDTILRILNILQLPQNYIETCTFKDMIFVLALYYNATDMELSRMAGNAVTYLANLAINNSQHLYER
ncbi:MAG: hypothetical protein NC124_03470 [Clostridium sp.]|nr:hypothetical protein [Clostridium sp.]